MDSLYLLILSLWLFAPLAMLLILLRATRRLATDYGQLRYLVVAIVPLALMLAIAFMFPEPSESERHLTRVGFFVGIPTFVYLLLSQMFFIGRGLLGFVR